MEVVRYNLCCKIHDDWNSVTSWRNCLSCKEEVGLASMMDGWSLMKEIPFVCLQQRICISQSQAAWPWKQTWHSFLCVATGTYNQRITFLIETGGEEWNILIMAYSQQIEYQEQGALGYCQLLICTPGDVLSSSINKNFNEKKASVLSSNTVIEKLLPEGLFNQISEWWLGKGSWREAGEQSYHLRSELTDTSFSFFFLSFFFYFISYLSFLLFLGAWGVLV